MDADTFQKFAVTLTDKQMKKSRSIIRAGAICSLALLTGSCATLLAPKNSQVVLYDAPEDLEVTENGNKVKLESVMADAKTRSNYEGTVSKTTAYYTTGIKLDRRKKHQVQLKSRDKTVTLDLKPKMSAGWLIVDLFTTGPIGIAIDAGTKKWKVFKSRNVDVPALFNGSSPRSAKQLKRDLRNQLSKK
jgi:hypothetical protein